MRHALLHNQIKKDEWFIISSGVLLCVASLAKLISSLGKSHILGFQDPIFPISFRWMFCIAGIMEMAVAYFCLFDKRTIFRAGLLALISTNILVYRLSLLIVGYHKLCSCLGNLTDALSISPQTADTAMKIILAYLLIGSYAILFQQWLKNRKLEAGRSKLGSRSSQSGAGG